MISVGMTSDVLKMGKMDKMIVTADMTVAIYTKARRSLAVLGVKITASVRRRRA